MNANWLLKLVKLSTDRLPNNQYMFYNVHYFLRWWFWNICYQLYDIITHIMEIRIILDYKYNANLILIYLYIFYIYIIEYCFCYWPPPPVEIYRKNSLNFCLIRRFWNMNRLYLFFFQNVQILVRTIYILGSSENVQLIQTMKYLTGILYYRGFQEKVPSAMYLCALGIIVSIERVYTPITFCMKSAVCICSSINWIKFSTKLSFKLNFSCFFVNL